MPPSRADERRESDFLFGALAVQAGLVDLARLAEAWDADPADRLADLLVRRGLLSAEDAALVECLRQRAEARHGPDAAPAVVSAGEDLRRWLADRPAPGASLPDLTPLPLPLSQPQPTLARDPFPRAAPPPVPAGPRYVRTRLHATGGLGRVWLARDTHLDRDVALKELRPEAAAQGSLGHRFLEEARVTGQLEHPGIVPVYDLDRPADGPAYYAMRFVRGATLGDAVQAFHRDRRTGGAGTPEMRGLLGAFVAVCNAVAYAHSRGVVHRDLKPHNVVLGDFGEVIVLDWGLAKSLRKDEAEPAALTESGIRSSPSPALTQEGQVLGTPSYMAPEQAAGRGGDIDERTDVYGLGAILYEILTDRPPFLSGDLGELLARVLTEDPERPRRLWPQAPTALEAVCLKALAKRPEDRYPDAAELGREVRRWLDDEPVRAYPDPVTARALRWGRRHRPLVAAGAALLVAAVAGLSLTTALVARAEGKTRSALERVTQEQDRTLQEHARASVNYRRALATVNRYCTEVSEEQLLTEPGLQGLRKALLADALKFYQELSHDPESDPQTEAEAARAARRLADLSEELTPGAEAPALYRQAIDRLARLAEAHPDEPAFVVELGETWNRLGGDLKVRGDAAGAEAAFTEAQALGERLEREHPGRGDHLRLLGRVHNNLGLLRHTADRPDDAAAEYEKALALREEFARAHPKDTAAQAERAQTLNNLAALCRARHEPGKAERLYKQALDVLRPLAGRLTFAADLAETLNNLGELYRQTERPAQAEGAYAEAIPLFDRLRHENPTVVRFKVSAAWCRYNRGLVLDGRGDQAGAETAYREAAGLLATLPVDYPDVPAFSKALAATCLRLADNLDKAGKRIEALPWYDQAVAVLGPSAEGQPGGLLRELYRRTLVQRAAVLTALGRHPDALVDWDRIIALDGEQRTAKEYLFGRVAARAHVGEYARAIEEGEQLASGKTVPGNWYDLACVYAIACGEARKDEKLTEAEREALAEKYARRAVELLEKAEAAGYFKAKANRDQFRTESDLGPVRKHPAFEELLKKLPGDAQP
jgi:serine/threonine-protein kinase